MYTYADAGLLLLPFPPEPAPLHLRFPSQEDGFLRLFDTDFYSDSYQMANLVCASTISGYDLGGEGDLFEALAPIIEEPELALDPMTAAAMSIISDGNDAITETTEAAANDDPLMSDVFYECKKEFLAMSATTGEPISNVPDIKITPLQAENVLIEDENKLAVEGLIERSISDGCLNSVDWAKGCTMRPNFLDFQGLDVQAAFGMRRAFSEGDIKILGNNILDIGNNNCINSPFEGLSTISDIKAEERREKLSRYRKKKSKRDFGRKIKYACRKALADSQPRVRGRFARTEDCEVQRLE